MSTKVFSSRVDGDMLAYADNLTRRDFGLSFGQYCGSLLLESVNETGKLPQLNASKEQSEKVKAAAFIKGFGKKVRNANIGKMSDSEIKDLIASRYE